MFPNLIYSTFTTDFHGSQLRADVMSDNGTVESAFVSTNRAGKREHPGLPVLERLCDDCLVTVADIKGKCYPCHGTA